LRIALIALLGLSGVAAIAFAADARSPERSIPIVCPAITLEPGYLHDAYLGEMYDVSVAASGGVAPYSFVVTGLPPGLTATPSSSSVRISGIPTAFASTSVFITGTDSTGCPFSRGFVFHVKCPLIYFPIGSLPYAQVGVPYDQTLTPTAGVPPFSFNVTGFPPELTVTLLPSGIRIRGTPTTRYNDAVTVSGADSNGCAFESFFSFKVSEDLLSSSFFTVTPCRLIDTRRPAGAYGGPAVSQYEDRIVKAVGRCDIPDTARAISLTMTVTQPTAAGGLRLWNPYPGGDDPVGFHYEAGQTRASNAIQVLSPTGEFGIGHYDTGTVDVVIDVNGYFQQVEGASLGVPGSDVATSTIGQSRGPYRFSSLRPCRIVDTLSPFGQPNLRNGEVRNFPIWGGARGELCGVPLTAKALLLQVHVHNQTNPGYLILYPYGVAQPLVSTINFNGAPDLGERSNGAIVELGSDPNFQLSVYSELYGGGTVWMALDVTGYFQ